jgi:hypothetical protein
VHIGETERLYSLSIRPDRQPQALSSQTINNDADTVSVLRLRERPRNIYISPLTPLASPRPLPSEERVESLSALANSDIECAPLPFGSIDCTVSAENEFLVGHLKAFD